MKKPCFAILSVCTIRNFFFFFLNTLQSFNVIIKKIENDKLLSASNNN